MVFVFVNFYSFFSASNCVRAVQNQPDTNCGVSDLKSFLYININININIIQNCKTTKKSQFTLLHFCIHSVFRKIAKASFFDRFTSTGLFGRHGLIIVLLTLRPFSPQTAVPFFIDRAIGRGKTSRQTNFVVKLSLRAKLKANYGLKL